MVAVVSSVCSEARGISVILVAWQGKARAQRRRGTLDNRIENQDLITMTAANSTPRRESFGRHYNCCGVVGKRTDTAYESGERSGAWIKLRAKQEQEFIIWRF